MAKYDAMNGTMCFGMALDELKRGQRVARQGWNGKGMWIAKQTNKPVVLDDTAMAYRDFIVMKTVNDELVPWVASQTDLLAEDWVTVF